MKFAYLSFSDKGAVRKENQDRVYAKTLNIHGEEAFLGIVCDGMGGLSFGSVASSTAVRIFSEWFEKEFAYVRQDTEISGYLAARWRELTSRANDELRSFGSENGSASGTTLSVLMIFMENYYVAQVGDSRVYKLSDDNLKQITTDHSYVAELAEKGIMTMEEARNSSKRNRLTRCIGVMEEVSPDLYSGSVHEGTMFILTSDGFHGKLSNGGAYEIFGGFSDMNKHECTKMIKHTVSELRANGENDNISIVCVWTK